MLATILVFVGAMATTAKPAEANHIAYSNISGKLTKADTGGSVPNGSVYLYRWNGSSWVNLGKKATSNQYGYYTISNVVSGYYYHVQASKGYGSCYSGQAIYIGSSQSLDLRNPASNKTVAHVSLYFHHWFYC
jgi:hypothetical protein